MGVGGERFFGRGDPSAVDERFDDVTGFVAGDVDPSQVDRQRFRVQNGRGQVGRRVRDVSDGKLDGFRFGSSVIVDGDDAIGVSRSEGEFAGRPSLGVGGERFLGRGDPSAVDERFDDVTSFVAGDVDPSQRSGRSRRRVECNGDVERGVRDVRRVEDDFRPFGSTVVVRGGDAIHKGFAGR